MTERPAPAAPFLVQDAGVQLDPDLSRMALKLFLPGADTHEEQSRVREIAHRVLDIPDDQVAAEAARIVTTFTGGVDHLTEVLQDHADSVSFTHDEAGKLTKDRRIIMGAAFTAEYSVEGAALCNPSVVPHPDQDGLEPGQLRVAVALRAIGEGHISSIEFVSAVIGPGVAWEFGERRMPLVQAGLSPPQWIRDHFVSTLDHEMGGRGIELTRAVAGALPEEFSPADFDTALHGLPRVLLSRPEAVQHLDHLRTIVDSAYRATFPGGSDLSQRILMPVTPDESNGMEDARFVLCTYPDGTTAYRATYTAYDGHAIAPRLIISRDLRDFEIHRLSGPAAKNKGMALFPRHVGGVLYALTRTDGETLGIATSGHGRVWEKPRPLHTPTQVWEIVQTGNCGSPLETERGWLVLTHGVGPMRRYSIGAILLDLDDPTRVLATLNRPLIETDGDREGYVPNVVYSCGGLIHDGRLWVPHGVGDDRIRVASVEVEPLLDAMTPVPA